MWSILNQQVFKRWYISLIKTQAMHKMTEFNGCTLSSVRLNDSLTRWQRWLLWLSPKTWAHKWQDMLWLLESLLIHLNIIPVFIDQSTSLHCLINLLEGFFFFFFLNIHHFIFYLNSVVFNKLQLSNLSWQGKDWMDVFFKTASKKTRSNWTQHNVKGLKFTPVNKLKAQKK